MAGNWPSCDPARPSPHATFQENQEAGERRAQTGRDAQSGRFGPAPVVTGVLSVGGGIVAGSDPEEDTCAGSAITPRPRTRITSATYGA